MRGFRPSRFSGDSEEHQRLMTEFREAKIREYRRRLDDGQGIFEAPPRHEHTPAERTARVRYRCQHCNSLVESPQALAGEADACPACGHGNILRRPEKPSRLAR